MVQYQDYIVGWLDSSVHDFLAGVRPGFASTRYALVTCLDSHLRPASLLETSPELRTAAPDAQALGDGLLLPTKQLIEADAGRRFLFGFDEVWFFPDDDIQPKPASAWLVGPARVDQAKLERLGEWMARNSCSLALGDGDGLNFVVKAHGLVKHVLAYSINQPQPA